MVILAETRTINWIGESTAMQKFFFYLAGLLCLSNMGCSLLDESARPVASIVPLAQIRKSADAQTGDMLKFLSKSIQYQSVEDFGYQLKPATEALMQYALNTGATMGFKTRRAAKGLVGVLEYGEGEESVGVLIHLDVVPVSDEERPQWANPPFSGAVIGGEVWGRGAQDDKGALASVLWAAKYLIDNKASFKRKLVIILGTKEEKSFEDLSEYFNEFPQKKFGPTFGFVPDGAYISQGEKGIADVDITFTGLSASPLQRDNIVDWRGGTAINTVADFSYLVIRSRDVEKTRAELSGLIRQVSDELKSGASSRIYGLTKAYQANLELQDYQAFVNQYALKDLPKGDLVVFSKGVATHGSAPWMGKNALVEVALLGDRMSQLPDNAYKQAFQWITSKIGLSTDGSGLGIPFTASAKLPSAPQGMSPVAYLGTSANLGLVNVNAHDDTLRLSIDFRTGFENTNDQVITHSQASAAQFHGTAAYQAGVGSHYEPFYYTADEPLLSLIINAYKTVNVGYPAETPYVFMTPATTYLKLVTNFVNFGPVDLYPDFYANYFHEKNERATIKNLVNNSILYAYTLQKMLQMDKAPVR